MARAAGSFEPVAAVRCPDSLAGLFLNQVLGDFPRSIQDAQAIRDYRESSIPGIYYFHIARTRYIDRAFVACLTEPGRVAQVVVLGAGYDSRAIRFDRELAGRPVFELDLPATAHAKATAVETLLGSIPNNFRFVPVDFCTADWALALTDHGYDASLPTLFVMEGLSYYLDPDTLGGVLRFVGAAAPGSALVFDFLDAEALSGKPRDFGTTQHFAYVERIGEPFRSGLEPMQLARDLSACGLRLVDVAAPDDLEKQELTLPDGHILGHNISHIYLAQAEPS